MILLLGRENLANYTNGGEGASGRVVSLETRAKISKNRSGIPMSDEHKAALSAYNTGRKLSVEARGKISASNRRRRLGPESIRKMSDSQPNTKAVCDSFGNKFHSISLAIKHLKANGFPKASDAAIIRVCKGKGCMAYGRSWAYASDIGGFDISSLI
jgi:hypothetical protein